jgi:hypothetical protein
MKMKFYKNCFWFFIPVILFDLVFTKYLPAQYFQTTSSSIDLAENIVRTVLIALSMLMIINLNDIKGKTGILIYIIGLLLYFLSYFILINYADTVWGRNIIIQLSGYWTPIIWLFGVGLIGKKLFFKIPFHYAIYLTLSMLFGIIHIYHGYILLRS